MLRGRAVSMGCVASMAMMAMMAYGGDPVNAKLPSTLYQHTLEDMKVGEQGWTVPWAMWASPDGTLWLNGKYTIHQVPGGTVQMQLLRMPDGFHVDIRQCPEFQWSPGEPSYVGGANPVPVIKLIQE